MPTEGQIGLNLLHELALVYLGLAQGADDELTAAESREVAARLRRWQPDKDPALIDHVLRDVALSYREEADADGVRAAVQHLGEQLSASLRQAILDDLKRVARADGTVLDVERTYIRRVADAWQVPYETDEAPSDLEPGAP